MSDKNLTASQEPDAAATYLTGVRERWEAVEDIYPSALAHLGKALSSTADVPRLLAAVEAALAHHQDDSYGRCVICLEHCTCVEDAYGSLPAPVPQAAGYAVMARAWEDCPHGNEPWPCKKYRDITAALTGEDGTDGN